MKVITARNVHHALPVAIKLLEEHGYERASRNGPVLIAPWPVATVYTAPNQRVLFYPERDANPFLHLYESLWMLAGRNDVAPLLRYTKQFTNYSDDGLTLHGAYGHRWRKWFGADQLVTIKDKLTTDLNDRRAVLQMWDETVDLAVPGRDVPCNMIATFQIDRNGALDLTVFCRSNDIIWGAYGANAVHFSFLLEYMAHWIGVRVGVYRQISVNWHGYTENEAFRKCRNLWRTELDQMRGDELLHCPYLDGLVRPVPMASDGNIERLDELIAILLEDADAGFPQGDGPDSLEEPFMRMAYLMLKAHEAYRTSTGDKCYDAMELLEDGDPHCDWIVAGKQWIMRRYERAKRADQEQTGVL